MLIAPHERLPATQNSRPATRLPVVDAGSFDHAGLYNKLLVAQPGTAVREPMDADLSLLAQQLAQADHDSAIALLAQAMSPAQHWTASGLYATRLFCKSVIG